MKASKEKIYLIMARSCIETFDLEKKLKCQEAL